MMLAGMSTMLMWESVMRMHTTALAPGLLVKRDLNIQKWHRGLSHVKPETLTITGGWHGRELRRRATPRSFVSGGVTHTPERRHTLCINQSPRYMPSVPPYNMMMTLSTNFHIDTIIYGICRSDSVQPEPPLTAGCMDIFTQGALEVLWSKVKYESTVVLAMQNNKPHNNNITEYS